MTTNITSTYYDDDALRQGYQKAVKRKLKSILDQIDYKGTLGHHMSEWHPDEHTQVNFEVHPGITGQMINVRVQHVKNQEVGEPKSFVIKEKPRPYLWFGVAAVNASGLAENDGSGYSILPALFAFEPEPPEEDGGYTWAQSLELCEGEGYLNLAFNLDTETNYGAFQAQLAEDVGGTAAQGGMDPTRWMFFGTGGDITYDFEGQNIFSTENLCLDYVNFRVPNGVAFDGTVKVTKNNFVLAGAVATPLLAPEAAYDDDHDLEYWQASVIADPSGVKVRRESPGHLRLYNDGGVGFSFSADEDLVLQTIVKAGIYRINVGAMGYECDTHSADIKARLILGKAGGTQSLEGDPDGDFERQDYDGTPVTIVDFDCEGIGSSSAQTVFNTYYARSMTLGGAHLYSNGDPDYGQMPADKGMWDQTVMVNVAESTYSLEETGELSPYWSGSGAIRFNGCDADGFVCEEGNNELPDPIAGLGFGKGGGPDIAKNIHYKVYRDSFTAPPETEMFRASPSDDGLGRHHKVGDVCWGSTALGLLNQIGRVAKTCNGYVEMVLIEDGYWNRCTRTGFEKGVKYFALGDIAVGDKWAVGELVYIAELYFGPIYRSNPPLNVPLRWDGIVVVARVIPQLMDPDWGDLIRCTDFYVQSGSSYWGDDKVNCDGGPDEGPNWGGLKAFLCHIADKALIRKDGQWVADSFVLEYDFDKHLFVSDRDDDSEEEDPTP